jgi:hypothetical protein
MLNPTCRSNINYVLLFKLNNSEAVERTIKAFLRGYFPQGLTYDQKVELYEQLTQDHHFLFIDNLSGSISRCKINL